MKEIFDLIERFLKGQYDPWAFSYDMPGELIERWETIDLRIAEELNENLPDICADYDDDYPLEKFKERVKAEYDRIRLKHKDLLL